MNCTEEVKRVEVKTFDLLMISIVLPSQLVFLSRKSAQGHLNSMPQMSRCEGNNERNVGIFYIIRLLKHKPTPSIILLTAYKFDMFCIKVKRCNNFFFVLLMWWRQPDTITSPWVQFRLHPCKRTKESGTKCNRRQTKVSKPRKHFNQGGNNRSYTGRIRQTKQADTHTHIHTHTKPGTHTTKIKQETN